MIRYDNNFSNINAVEAAIESIPKTIEFQGMSKDVVRLYSDISLHCDAIVGYASWYVRRATPSFAENPFVPDKLWSRLEELESQVESPVDKHGLNKARELAEFTNKLASLMFKFD